MAPVRPGERWEILDLLRGFALFGILVVNSMLFFGPLHDLVLPDPTWARPADHWVRSFVTILFEGKFYTTFAFLFGVGAALQYRRCRRQERAFLPFFWRRMSGLLLIGLIHATMLWFGDILVMYAICGFALAVLALLPQLFQRLLALTLVLLPIALTVLIVVLFAWMSAIDETGDLAAIQAEQVETNRWLRDHALQTYPGGSWSEILEVRLAELGAIYQFSIVLLPAILGLMLIGFQFGLTNFFRDVSRYRGRLMRWLPAAAIVGLGLSISLGWAERNGDPMGADGYSVLTVVAMQLGAPALAATYGIVIWHLHTTTVFGWIGPLLGPVGRMAATHYLLQSVVMTTIANSWGLGLYGQISPAAGIAVAVGLFAVQIYLSQLWMARFTMGPVEWVWRVLTYGTRPALRRPC